MRRTGVAVCALAASGAAITPVATAPMNARRSITESFIRPRVESNHTTPPSGASLSPADGCFQVIWAASLTDCYWPQAVGQGQLPPALVLGIWLGLLTLDMRTVRGSKWAKVPWNRPRRKCGIPRQVWLCSQCKRRTVNPQVPGSSPGRGAKLHAARSDAGRFNQRADCASTGTQFLPLNLIRYS